MRMYREKQKIMMIRKRTPIRRTRRRQDAANTQGTAEGQDAADTQDSAEGQDAAGAGNEAGPQVSAPSAILMEASTGQIIYEKDADEQRPPASVTKIMTLLLIFDALDSGKISLEDEVSTSEYAASMGGSQVFLNRARRRR